MGLTIGPLTLFVLAAILVGCHAQPTGISGVEIRSVAGGIGNQPFKIYNSAQYSGTRTSQGTITLDSCIVFCYGISDCRAIDWGGTGTGTGTCFTISANLAARSTICELTNLATVAGITHYALIERCDLKSVVPLSTAQLTLTTGTTYAGTAATGDACGLACMLTTNCVAADFNTVGPVCRHFATTNGALPSRACYATTAVASSTAYTLPCINGDQTFYSAVSSGAVAGLTAQTADIGPNGFFICQTSCTTSSTCIGFRYDTTGEFTNTGIASRCSLYRTGTLTEAAMCAATTATDNVYTIVRNVCRDLSNFFITTANVNYGTATTTVGVQALAHNNDRQCSITCAESPACVSYVFDTANGKCWQAIQEVYECETQTFPTTTNFNHKRLRAACQRAKYDVRRNSLISPTTALAQTAATITACLTACDGNAACRGLFWNVDANSCTLDVTTSGNCPVPTTSTTGYTALKKYSCPKARGFMTSIENTTIPASAATAGITTEGTCLQDCQTNAATCRAAVWNRDTSVCLRLTGATADVACTSTTRTTLSNSVIHTFPVCPVTLVTFTKTDNQQVIGATVQAAITDLTACQTGCNADSTCVGIDWDKVTTTAAARCWFHTEAKGGCNSAITATCCDHYQKTPTACNVVDGYSMSRNVNMNTAGALQSGTITAAACQTLCTASATCEGYDFNTANQCLLYTKTNVCGQFKVCTGCNNYRKVRFECTFKFVNSNKQGGTLVTALGSGAPVQECEKQCRLDTTCQGFDFNTDPSSTQPCWLHKTTACTSSLLTSSTVNHYRIRTIVCTGEPATALWANVEQNSHTVGNSLLLAGSAVSAVECIKMCSTATPTLGCAGVDYDKASQKCYLVKRVNACGVGITDNCCDRIVLPTGCAAQAVTGYTATTQEHRLLGVKRTLTGTVSPTTCGALCTSEPLCGGYDFDLKGECWTHTRTQECRNVNPIFGNTCCDHYVKTSTCTGYKTPDFTGYTTLSEKSVRQGVVVADKLTEAQCIAECDKQAGACGSIDFNFKSNTCYVHTNTTGCGPIIPNGEVHRYTKDIVKC